MSGGGAGIGRRGGLAAVDTQDDQVGGSWEYFRYGGSGRTYVWGNTVPGSFVPLVNTLINTAGSEDVLRAYPQIFPRAGIIGDMGWFNPVVYAGGGGELRFGVYSDNNGVPGTLLFDSGAFTSWPDPAFPTTRWRKATANLQVDDMTVLWLAWIYNATLRAAGQRVWTMNSQVVPALLGYFDPEVVETGDSAGAGPRIPGSASAQIGWRAPQAYGALPLAFPTTGRVAIAMNNSTLEPTSLDGNVLAVSYKFTLT